MPYRKKQYKRKQYRRKHKQYRKKKYASSRQTTFQRQLIVSDRTFVKLKYMDITTPTFASGATTRYNTYYGNGAWDVNAALANTAMPGLAEWASFYNRYRVHGV